MKKIILIFLILNLINCELFREKKLYFEVTAKDGLIMRQGPDQKFEKIATLPYKTSGQIINFIGDTKTIQGKSGRWIEVETNNFKGFIFSGFVIIHIEKPTNNSNSNEKKTLSMSGISELIEKNKSIKNISTDFFNEYAKYDNDLKLKEKVLFENDLYKIYLVSLFDSFKEIKTIIINQKTKNINFIPNFNNFHPIHLAENNKMIYGYHYRCYECDSNPYDINIIVAKDKIYSINVPFEDTEAFCALGGDEFNDKSIIRITDSNDLIIKFTSFTCNENTCPESKKEEGCTPNQITSEEIILIEKAFEDPKIISINSKNLPANFNDLYKKSRKLKISKKL